MTAGLDALLCVLAVRSAAAGEVAAAVSFPGNGGLLPAAGGAAAAGTSGFYDTRVTVTF